MSKFSYVAKLPDGRRVNGAIEAASQAAVLEALHHQGLVVINVAAAKSSAPAFSSGRVGLDDLAVFARQMATLVDAGIPIVGGLDAVAEQVENKKLKEVVGKVRDSVEGGTNLTAAIAKQNAVFSPLFVSMVKAGEASGHLAEILLRLATYLEKSAALQRKIQAACIYPAIVIFMAFTITSLLMLKVIPSFKDVFKMMGVTLPLPTQILLAVSDFFQQAFLPFVGALVFGVIMIRRFIKSPKGRLMFDRVMLKLWIIGPIVRKVAIAKFARTFATLIRSGVQILNALEIVADTSGNQVVSNAVMQVKASIKEGENIAGPLASSGVFPPLVVRMVAVGEQTGRLDEMLTKVAEFYEEQVDTAVGGLTSALEPMIIAVLGVVVGGIVFSILLPIFKLSEVLTR